MLLLTPSLQAAPSMGENRPLLCSKFPSLEMRNHDALRPENWVTRSASPSQGYRMESQRCAGANMGPTLHALASALPAKRGCQMKLEPLARLAMSGKSLLGTST